ncbi:MAG TPA: response regulator [Gemmatimonadales bacterium]|nr:response regulator [Gemmatimonadales bacterium]
MTGPATILVVEDAPEIATAFRDLLVRRGGHRVETAADGTTALALARTLLPDLILSDYAMPGMDGFELCRRAREDPALAGTMFLIVSGVSEVPRKVEGLAIGVDDYVTKPVDPDELLARVQALLRTKRLADELRAEKAEEARLRAALEQAFDQLLALLLRLVDLHSPGAADRGRRLARVALDLADRFEVPAELLRDLELAALLQEVGRVVLPGAPAAGDRDAWPEVAATQALLRGVDRLTGAAELLGAICENWDGTGLPDRRQRGDIPLRSRILRAARDFFVELDRLGPGPEAAARALAAIATHRGTRYDPLVVAHLEAVVTAIPEGNWRATRRRLPVEALEAGMVLADDLTTSAGVKLLSRGAALTPSSLEIIRRRHQTEPFVHGVWVRSDTAAG